jgi:hypothetical protein
MPRKIFVPKKGEVVNIVTFRGVLVTKITGSSVPIRGNALTFTTVSVSAGICVYQTVDQLMDFCFRLSGGVYRTVA